MRFLVPWLLVKGTFGRGCALGGRHKLIQCVLGIGTRFGIIPVLNKIDLPSAEPARVMEEIEEVKAGYNGCCNGSAKSGEGIQDVLEALVASVPPPVGADDDRLRALIVDSWFDSYVGVVIVTSDGWSDSKGERSFL